MRHGGIDRNDQVALFDGGGGVGEVGESLLDP